MARKLSSDELAQLNIPEEKVKAILQMQEQPKEPVLKYEVFLTDRQKEELEKSHSWLRLQRPKYAREQ